MTATTPNRAYPYPQGADFLGDTASAVQALAEAVDTDVETLAADSQPRLRVHQTGDVLLNDNVQLAIPWGSSAFAVDESSGITAEADGDLVVSEAGLYLVIATVVFEARAGGVRVVDMLGGTGATQLFGRHLRVPAAGGIQDEVQLTHLVRLAAGGSARVRAWQNSGAAMYLKAVSVTAGTVNALEMVRVSA